MIEIAIDIPVARISPMKQDLIPLNTACTLFFFKIFLNRMVTIIIMVNDGKMTPAVEKRAPQNPAWLLPI